MAAVAIYRYYGSSSYICGHHIIQLQRERAEVIDRDNMTLMKKMESINHRKPGGPGLDHVNQYHGKHHRLDGMTWSMSASGDPCTSLNLEQREREFRRVAKENEVYEMVRHHMLNISIL